MWKKNILETYSDVFFAFFHKANSRLLKQKLDVIGFEIVLNTLIDEFKENRTYNSLKVMDLWIAMDNYLNEEGGSLKVIKSNIFNESREIIINKGEINSDDMYYFMVGQVTYYLLSNSESNKKTQDMFEPIIRSNNIVKLKLELRYMQEKYSHKLYLNSDRFNNIMSQLMTNIPENSVKEGKNMILAGMLASNAFYDTTKSNNLENGGN